MKKPPITRRTESHRWVTAEAGLGNSFARYVLAWLRSDRATELHACAKAWLEGIAAETATLRSEWAKAILWEIDEPGRYRGVAS